MSARAGRLVALGAVVVTCGVAVRAWGETAGGVARPAPRCAPLAFGRDTVRVAFGQGAAVRVAGGSGSARIAADGDTAGTTVDPGGGVHAGDRAARFDVVARDAACGAEARAHVEVVAPLAVEARAMRIRPGQTVRFVASGGASAPRFRLLSEASGARLGDDGTFTAPAHEGHWNAVASDDVGRRDVSLEVDVATRIPPLQPASLVLAIPAGARAPMAWSGGSGSIELRAVPEGAARVERAPDGSAWILPVTGAHTFDVEATDRVTREHATLRVIAAAPFGPPPALGGTSSFASDVATGDVNGDGRRDLVVGHAERARSGVDAGGLLVFYGREGGAFAPAPDVVIDGDRAGDRFGSVLVVRDVNRDGVDDVIVGAPDADLGGAARGTVSIFAGGKGTGLGTRPVRVLGGEAPGHRFGSAIAARDLDGDGAPDLVIGAPEARSPFARECAGGRAYVFRSAPGEAGIEGVSWQTIELRDALTDDAESPVTCGKASLGAGSALAILDVDGDGALDLAVGAPSVSYPAANGWHGAVDVYRGESGRFAAAPSWAVHLEPKRRVGQVGFGGALDVVTAGGRELLVVRERTRGPNGGGALWVFDGASLGAPLAAAPGGRPRVRVVTTAGARASYAEPDARGAAMAAAIADVDGDGHPDYVAAVAGGDATRFVAFPLDAMASKGALTPSAVATVPNRDRLGARLAALPAANAGKESADGLVLLASQRTTAAGSQVGAIDVIAPSPPASLAARLAARAAIALPNVGAGDHAGATVALARGSAGSGAVVLVGTPRARTADGARWGAGRIDLVDASGASVGAISGAGDGGSVGHAAATPIDFDGDGTSELAVADFSGSHFATDPPFVDPDACLGPGAGHGTVRILARDGDRFVERARVVPAPLPGGGPVINGFGTTFAVADVNGDGKSDVIAASTQPWAATAVTLGRPFVPGKIVVACRRESGPGSSLLQPPTKPPSWLGYGGPLARVGDIDRDGCDEVAIAAVYAGGHGGVAIAFGYDAGGARCHGHASPHVVTLVGSDPAAARMPATGDDGRNRMLDYARYDMALSVAGGVDLTRDGVPDLALGDGVLRDDSGAGPAVEIVSGAWIASLCPGHTCPSGPRSRVWSQDGWMLAPIDRVGAPDRFVLRGELEDRRFGAAIAVGDLDGDHVPDVAVGAPDATGGAPFAGAVRVYRGPAWGPALAPWLVALGDARERGGFGESIAIGAADPAGAGVLAIGAPRSSRAGVGNEVGAAYVFRVGPRGGR